MLWDRVWLGVTRWGEGRGGTRHTQHTPISIMIRNSPVNNFYDGGLLAQPTWTATSCTT